MLNKKTVRDLDVFNKNQDRVVLAADTIVVFNNKIYGKPIDEDDALKMLEEFSGNTHEVITGVCVASSKGINVNYEVSKVTFKNISKEEILDYIATKEPMDKAGSYGIQGGAALFCTRMVGDYYNVMGLPVCRLGLTLREMAPDLMGDML